MTSSHFKKEKICVRRIENSGVSTTVLTAIYSAVMERTHCIIYFIDYLICLYKSEGQTYLGFLSLSAQVWKALHQLTEFY